jgi:hypothetical protein
MDDKINSNIPIEVINEVRQLLNNAALVLKPYLIALTPAERQAIPKMSDKTLPFVEKTIAYGQTAPEFAPQYMNKEALESDHTNYEQLIPLFRLVKQLSDGLDDTSMQAGGACYTNALNYYNSVKQAARIDVPGAKAIHEDLRKRFIKSKTEEEITSD